MEQEALCRIEEKVDKIYKALFEGNGKPSLMTRMELVEKTQTDCPVKTLTTEFRDLKEGVNKIKNQILGGVAVLSTIAGVIGFLIKNFIK